MKSVLISIRPMWVAKILRGEKTTEIRKTMPRCSLPIDVYIYCTKSNWLGFISKPHAGKVVAKFTLKQVKCGDYHDNFDGSCVSSEELKAYMGGKPNCFFGWVIDNLEYFSKPKELSEFSGIRPNGLTYMLEKAPQSWCYVETGE